MLESYYKIYFLEENYGQGQRKDQPAEEAGSGGVAQHMVKAQIGKIGHAGINIKNHHGCRACQHAEKADHAEPGQDGFIHDAFHPEQSATAPSAHIGMIPGGLLFQLSLEFCFIHEDPSQSF